MNKFLRDDILQEKNDVHINNKTLLDLTIICIWIIITSFSIIIPGFWSTYIRTILAIPVVLFIPGYVLIAALFPRKDDIGIIERIVLSFGLSIVLIPLLGLLINFTFGIKLVPILVVLYIYTMIFISITIYRRKKLSEDVQFSVQFDNIYGIIRDGMRPKNSTDSILTIILIFTVVLTVGTIYYTITVPKIGEKFTEFYILNSDGKANNYSTNLRLNSPAVWLVGVTNREYTAVNYTVQIVLDKNILTTRTLILDNDEKWEKNITFIPDKVGTNKELEFLLFKDNNFTAPYRSLRLWINTV